MSSERPQSPHSPNSSSSINPYASGQVEAKRQEQAHPGEDPTPRAYQARLTWADRQLFLRSVAPTRVDAVASGLLWLKNLYDLFRWVKYSLIVQELPWDAFMIVFAAVGLLQAMQAVISFYSCWLCWRYADQLQAAAGGATASFRDWARLHWQSSWWFACSALTGIAIEGGNWLVGRLLENSIR